MRITKDTVGYYIDTTKKSHKNAVAVAYAERFGVTRKMVQGITAAQLTLCKSDEARRILLGVSQ